MPPNLSIFSSKPAIYLSWLFLTLVFAVTVTVGISWLGMKYGLIDHKFHRNYQLQLSKLESITPIDTLFVGDSSLGALLDVDRWSNMRGLPGQHLALTASYGYAGSLNMLRRHLAGIRPRNVVIFHTVDMMSRDPAYLGYLQSLPDDVEIQGVSIWVRISDQFEFYFSNDIVTGTLRGAWKKLVGRTSNDLGRDYMQIPNETGATREILPGKQMKLISAEINPQKMLFLKKISELCQAESLNCIYAHGPIYEQICETSQSYFDTVGRLIGGVGLKVVPGTPVCVPQSWLADAVDHIRPELKPFYTRQYFALLRPFLI